MNNFEVSYRQRDFIRPKVTLTHLYMTNNSKLTGNGQETGTWAIVAILHVYLPAVARLVTQWLSCLSFTWIVWDSIPRLVTKWVTLV